MKRIILIVLLVAALFYGCDKTEIKEQKLTLEEAAELGMNRVYELAENKEAIDENGMKLYKSTYEEDKERWMLLIQASHTIVKTYVYNNGTIKIMPTTLG